MTVVVFPGVTRLDLPVDRVIDAANDAKLTGVVVTGYTESGERYFASSFADGAEVLWLLECAKTDLLSIKAPE